ncbi:MAG: hypothetical protein ACYC99_09785 [Candidatus Geothermincolia bacterium]
MARMAKDRRDTDSDADRPDVGYLAEDNYKARLTKGLLGVDLGEGYIVEVVNFRSKRVLRRELFESSEIAREELDRVRSDIESMTTEEFRRRYLKPPG